MRDPIDGEKGDEVENTANSLEGEVGAGRPATSRQVDLDDGEVGRLENAVPLSLMGRPRRVVFRGELGSWLYS